MRSNAQNWNVNSVWSHSFADDSELEISGYYTGYHRDDPTFDETRQTIDLDLRHRFQPWDKHDIVWGVAFRHTQADTVGSEFLSLNPAQRGTQTYSAFFQDDIALTDELHLILGTKIEHNGYTGIEVQPNVRMRWSPNDRNTLWAAVSRAVRTPSQAEDDIRIRSATTAAPGEIAFLRYDNEEFESEDLLATELGYRIRATDSLAFDLAAFFNHYSNFRSLELGPAFVENGVNVIPIAAKNNASAETYGFELAMDWAPKSWWQIRAGYAYLRLHYDLPTNDPITGMFGRDTPRNQITLQNRFNLPHNIDLDTTLRYVDALSALEVESYVELDARLAWRPREDLEVALVGQNLLDSGRFEFAPTFVNQVPTQVERGVYAKVTWRFKPGARK
jgi:iron complex outermembrane receptor protein